MNKERQARLLADIRDKLGEPEVVNLPGGTVTLSVADTHWHEPADEKVGDERPFHFEGASVLDAAVQAYEHIGHARAGEICHPGCINYHPARDSDL